MQVIYQAFDGELFTSPEACLEHEKQNPKFKMWDTNGVTSSPDRARVVWFSKQANARRDFIELCRSEDITSEGIDDDEGGYDTEIYLWCDDLFQWVPMDEMTIQSVARYLAEP